MYRLDQILANCKEEPLPEIMLFLFSAKKHFHFFCQTVRKKGPLDDLRRWPATNMVATVKLATLAFGQKM